MVKTKKQIKAKIAANYAKIEKIDTVLNTRPLSELIEINSEFQQLLERNPTIKQRTSKQFLKKIEALQQREDKAKKTLVMQQNTDKLITKKIQLEDEISKLTTELYYIEHRERCNTKYHQS